MSQVADIRLSIRLGRSYKGLAQCHDRFCAVEGPRGTGKTRCILTLKMLKGMQYPGTRIALARAKRTALTETVLNTLEQQVFPALRIPIPGGANRENRSSYHVQGDGYDFHVVPIGLDNPEQKQKLFSSEWTDVYVAEAGECEQDAIEMLGPTLRHYPAATSAGRTYTQCVLDHNPLAPAHWLYKKTEDVDKSLRRAINGMVTREDYERMQAHNLTPAADPRNAWKRIITKHMDNPGYWDFDAWEFTELGRDYLATLDYLKGFQRRRMLDGEPCAAEGSVYPEFEQHEGQHVCDEFSISDWPVIVYYDPGYDHPCAVGFMALAPDGQPFVVDEIYGSRLRLDELAEQIHAKVARNRYNVVDWLADPNGAFQERQEASGRSIADQLHQDHGLVFRRWPRAVMKEKQAQVENLRNWLVADNPIKFFRRCANHIMEMQSWMFKRMADGSIPQGDDAYEDRHNHAIDGLCGALATRPSVERGVAGVMKRAS